MTTRRPSKGDKRGSSRDRKRRRLWLLATFDVDLGPDRARCSLRLSPDCERTVTIETLSVDRIDRGGSYAHDNIQPACQPCQSRQGGLGRVRQLDDLLAEYRAARDQWVIRFEETNTSYYPGIIAVEQRKARRGGRREVTDWIAENPPPRLKDWLVEHYAAQRPS